MTSETAGQGPAGSLVVMVSVTSPAVMSAADGVYTAASKVLSTKLPVPDVAHVEEVADPPRTPIVVKVEPSQIVSLTPAPTVAIGLMLKIMALLTAKQGCPTPSGSLVVIVSVTVPVPISKADGV